MSVILLCREVVSNAADKNWSRALSQAKDIKAAWDAHTSGDWNMVNFLLSNVFNLLSTSQGHDQVVEELRSVLSDILDRISGRFDAVSVDTGVAPNVDGSANRHHGANNQLAD